MNCCYGNYVCQIEDLLLRLEMDGVQWRTDATPFHVANYLYVYISNRMMGMERSERMDEEMTTYRWMNYG